MTISSYDASMDPPSPTVGSPIKPTSPEKPDLPPTKKQLPSAQKASLARAREKARQSKLAKSQAKAEQEKEFAKFQGPSPVKEAADEANSIRGSQLSGSASVSVIMKDTCSDCATEQDTCSLKHRKNAVKKGVSCTGLSQYVCKL